MAQAAAAQSLAEIYRPIAEDFVGVNEIIRTLLQSPVPLIGQVASYILASGGKRLRPAVLLLAARACGYQGRAHLELAAAVEFVHTATLLHDDVVDNSELRRGRRTSNLQFGNPAAVLVGDFLYSRAFLTMVRVNVPAALEVLAETTKVIAEGEILQLTQCGNPDLSEDDYLKIIQQKTAKLFEAAARIGSLLGTTPQPMLATYGMCLGMAFQIVDDVLDYSGDEAAFGKRLGDDLREGKTTLPLIIAIKRSAPATAERIRRAIRHGLEEGDEAAIFAAVREHDGNQLALQAAEVESQRAIAALAALPDSPWKGALENLARSSVSRSV